MKKQILLAVLLSVVCFTDLRAQSWWRAYPQDSLTDFTELIPTEDGNFMMLSHRYNSFDANRRPFSYIFHKIDPSNGVVLTKDTIARSLSGNGKSFPIANKGLLTFTTPTDSFISYTTIDSKVFYVTRYDSIYNVVNFDSIKSLNGFYYGFFVKRNDSTFATVGRSSGGVFRDEGDSINLAIFNPLSLIVNHKRWIDTGQIIGVEALRNGYIVFYSRRDSFFRVETSLEGMVLNRRVYTNLLPRAWFFSGVYNNGVQKDRQGNMFIVTQNMIAKFNAVGDFLWKRNTMFNYDSWGNLLSENRNFRILPNGSCVIGQVLSETLNGWPLPFNLAFYKISAEGDSIWWKESPTKTAYFKEVSHDMNLTNDGGILLSGTGINVFANNQVIRNAQLVKFDGNGDLRLNFIHGKIKKDSNNNCLIDATDVVTSISGVIEATRDDGVVYKTTVNRADGSFNMLCDTGSYTLKFTSLNALWQNCTPSVSRRISTVGTTDTVDFLLKPVVNCPLLTVDLLTNGFRRCLESSVSVKYCNNGTIPATNAYVDIRLDSLIEFTSATRPVASQNRNVFRFNLGTIGIGECGNFTINGRVRCGDSTRLGQTLCNEAHIYPDSVCVPTGTFSGANLTVSGSCVGDSVQFIVRNIGTVTSQNARSVVIEDEVLFMRNNINGLSPNATFSKKYKANGSTWRMTVEQEPNHPTSQFPTAFVEGCGRNGNGGVSTGFGTTFGNDDATPSVSTLCRPIVGSFDPNDKQGFPTGYKTEHFIRQNQDLDYVIRFQNTGTDTAFLVTIRDTLSDVLDLASIEFGGSSHAYEADIYGKNIVKFTFRNINLPDSFKNVAASQGFVKFRIKQKKDLPIGTKIKNNAGIYFDFNDPIITNTTLHTVAKDLLITAIFEPEKSHNSLTINVLPNPFTEHATFELLKSNKPFNVELSNPKFELYDALGRLLRSEKITNARFDFHRKDLSNGLYFFKITENGKVLGNGKLMIQ